MKEGHTKNARKSITDKTVSKIRKHLLIPVDTNTLRQLRKYVGALGDQLQSEKPISPPRVNDIIILMQEIFETGEQFLRMGIRNIEGAPQLRHDLFLIIALLPDLTDRNSLEPIELTPSLTLYDWLVQFKDSENFDRKAKHPLSLSHIVIRALICFGLDSHGRYDVEDIFQTLGIAVFKRQVHHSYFEYTAQYVRLKFSS